MIALGNDVIDLNWSPKNGDRYFERLGRYAFSSHERNLIRHFPLAFNVGVMLLWSIKEACYKSAVKVKLVDVFLPKEVNITSLQEREGSLFSSVQYQGSFFKSSSVISSDRIHTISIIEEGNFNQIHLEDSDVRFANYSAQSSGVRALVKSYIGEKDVKFIKSPEGIPSAVLPNGKELEVSFSHDQGVIGFALVK